jgi:hypothetical protein
VRFDPRCQPHRKCESQRHVTGCCASRSRLRDLICRTTADQTAAVVPQPTKRQHFGDQIDATFIFARTDFVMVHLSPVGKRRIRFSPLKKLPLEPNRDVDRPCIIRVRDVVDLRYALVVQPFINLFFQPR